MTVTMSQYLEAKKDMESIIDRHMEAAFREIHERHGVTPTAVDLEIDAFQSMDDQFAKGVYQGCAIKVDNE